METAPRTHPEGPPALLTDGTVGKLTRWLRILGYDTRHVREEDALVAHTARAEGRILVTRKPVLAARPGLRTVLVVSGDAMAQLSEVIDAVGPAPQGTPPRCMVCNTPLEEISQAAAAAHVPPYVAVHQQVFHHCPGCGRIYWQGTHWEHIRRRVSGAATLTKRPDHI